MFLEEHRSGKLSKWAGVDHVVHPVDGAIETYVWIEVVISH